MRWIRQLGAFFFWPDTRHATSTIAQAEFPVVQAITVGATFSRTGSFLAILAVSDGVRLSGRTLVRFGEAKIGGGSQVTKQVINVVLVPAYFVHVEKFIKRIILSSVLKF